MKGFLKTGLGFAALVGTLAVAATPAEARPWGRGGYGYGGGYGGRGYYGHRGGGAGLAIGAGILGLAAGAAIASRPYYGGGGYYGGYGGGYGYGYAPPPPPYAYEEVCRSRMNWDPYIGRYVRVRYCD